MTLSPASFLNVLRTRRSVRSFLPEQVPQGDLHMIIEAASWAPSGTNRQNWRFIAVTDPGVRESLKDIVVRTVEQLAARIPSPKGRKEYLAYGTYYSFFSSAPVVVAVVKRPYESLARRIMERYDIAGGATSSADVQGPAAALQNMLLMAHVLGYGSCWMTGPLIARTELERMLDIVSPDELMALVPIGKPAAPTAVPARKHMDEILQVR